RSVPRGAEGRPAGAGSSVRVDPATGRVVVRSGTPGHPHSGAERLDPDDRRRRRSDASTVSAVVVLLLTAVVLRAGVSGWCVRPSTAPGSASPAGRAGL